MLHVTTFAAKVSAMKCGSVAATRNKYKLFVFSYAIAHAHVLEQYPKIKV